MVVLPTGRRTGLRNPWRYSGLQVCYRNPHLRGFLFRERLALCDALVAFVQPGRVASPVRFCNTPCARGLRRRLKRTGGESMIRFPNGHVFSGRRGMRILGAALVLAFLVVIQTASAESTAAIDDVTAAGLCATSYPPTSGTEPLARGQWAMEVVNAIDAHATATGAGVKVGVIDGGIDFTHPDLAGAIDVARSCSFIFSTTP